MACFTSFYIFNKQYFIALLQQQKCFTLKKKENLTADVDRNIG